MPPATTATTTRSTTTARTHGAGKGSREVVDEEDEVEDKELEFVEKKDADVVVTHSVINHHHGSGNDNTLFGGMDPAATVGNSDRDIDTYSVTGSVATHRDRHESRNGEEGGRDGARAEQTEVIDISKKELEDEKAKHRAFYLTHNTLPNLDGIQDASDHIPYSPTQITDHPVSDATTEGALPATINTEGEQKAGETGTEVKEAVTRNLQATRDYSVTVFKRQESLFLVVREFDAKYTRTH